MSTCLSITSTHSGVGDQSRKITVTYWLYMSDMRSINPFLFFLHNGTWKEKKWIEKGGLKIQGREMEEYHGKLGP
ncbi:UNVERIFIED_CONTAM: hypothetical protein FKN15_015669 [Acipenser sinensis]